MGPMQATDRQRHRAGRAAGPFAVLCLFEVLLASPAPPVLAGASDDDAAQAKLKEGTEAFRVGLYQHALDEFEAALALRPSPRLEYNIGETLLALRREPEAADSFDAFLNQAPTEDVEFREEARRQLTALSVRTLSVVLPCAPVAYELFVDDEKRTPPHPRNTFRVTAAPHHIVVRRLDGSNAADAHVVGRRGQQEVVSLCSPPAFVAPAQGSGLVTLTPAEAPSWWTRPHVALVVGAAALVAIAAVMAVAMTRSDPPSSSLGNYPL